MMKWLWVGLLGAVLLVPAALYWAWTWIYDPVRPPMWKARFGDWQQCR